MWRHSCWLTLNVVYICVLLCPLIASKGIDEVSVCIEGTYEGDPRNPAAYFQCLDGKILFQSCPEQSYFDSEYLVCAVKEHPLPELVNCIEGDLKTDLTDCSGYFQCIAGELVKQKCANGSFFNPTIETCVIDVYGNCKEKCSEGLLTENPDNCAEYYECIDEKFIKMQCPSGSYFDPELDGCVMDEQGICPTSRKEVDDEDEYDEVEETKNVYCSEGELEDEPDDLTLFYKCVNGEFVEFCCPNGHFFDTNAKTCLRNCLTKTCVEGDFKEDVEDSAVYFKCINGQFIKEVCPSEHFFELTLKKCILDDEIFD